MQETNPTHYTAKCKECIVEMYEKFGHDAVMHFCQLNAYKYNYRQHYKGQTEQDVAKAKWCDTVYNQLRQGSSIYDALAFVRGELKERRCAMVKSIENQLPPDFKNCIELYFYIKEHNLEALDDYFVSYLDFIRNEKYKIEVRYLEKQVLKEILAVLPSKKTVICAINELQKNIPFFMREIKELKNLFEIVP